MVPVFENLSAKVEDPQEIVEVKGETPENGQQNEDPMEPTEPVVLPILEVEQGVLPMLEVEPGVLPMLEAEPMQEGTETGETAEVESITNDVSAAMTDEPPVIGAIPEEDNGDRGLKRKSSAVMRQKNKRLNRLLRQAVQPRSALKALQELKDITIGDVATSSIAGAYTSLVTVNGKQYEGHGSSNMAAVDKACEKALCEQLVKKWTPMVAAGAVETDNPEYDKSMLTLASFALYKLFGEWESQGCRVPGMEELAKAETPTEAVFTRADLPVGWKQMHPASLLCMMRPNMIFVDKVAPGEQHDDLKFVGITVDNQSFEAHGRSKKIARLLVSISACNALFGTDFSYPDAPKD